MRWFRTNRTLTRLIDEQALIIQALTTRATSAEEDMAYWQEQAEKRMESITRLDADLELAYQARDDAMMAYGVMAQRALRAEQDIATLTAQIGDRDERIAGLEKHLARKRIRKPKTEPTGAVGSEAMQ